MKKYGIVLFLTLLFVLNYYTVAIAQMTGLQFYENLELLPYIDLNTKVHYESSFDRTGGNDDGFTGAHSALYVDENGEHVLFDQEGPGCVYSFYFTGNIDARLKFYFDGEKTPRIDYPVEQYFTGEKEPFVYPLVYNQYQSTGSYTSVLPIEFEKHLIVTTDKRIGFYNIYSQTYKNGILKSFNREKDFINLQSLFNQCGADFNKTPADTVIEKIIDLDGRKQDESLEVFSLQGEGTVLFIKFNPLFEPDPFDLNNIYLRIYYDNKDTPAIDVPIGLFFGSGLGETSVRSLFVGMSPSGNYYCFLPMPFTRGIKIELANKKYNLTNYPRSYEEYYFETGVSLKPLQSISDYKIGYLGAKYKNEYPAVGNKNYEIFTFQGTGAVIGQVVAIEPVHPQIKRWWEGDMYIYIDGKKDPCIHGTGHEEDLSMGGWSSRWMLNPFSLPLFGAPKSQNLKMVDGQINGSVTTYRFWPGKIPFSQSINMSIEHGTNNDRAANYSSLVYFYFVPGKDENK
ncbi:MAG: DUF2961 domain-containing protein [Bacteroidales bacterium]|nr:DUF2961 domain-containing protein [Bacteroidales bacterium]